jgi:dephospho-CoA kinase
MGAGVVEGDQMGRQALETDAQLCASLVQRFGRNIIDFEGNLIRKELARRAFADNDAQKDLTRLTFPALYHLAKEQLEALSAFRDVVVFDAALIYEWRIERDFQKIVVVTAPRETLIRRAVERLNVTETEAIERLLFQIPPEEKIRRADYVIVNDGDLEALRTKSLRVWENFIASLDRAM